MKTIASTEQDTAYESLDYWAKGIEVAANWKETQETICSFAFS